MASRHDPRLLYSVPNIRAYHIQDGNEFPLNDSGSQTLSLLLVPSTVDEHDEEHSHQFGDKEPGARPATPEEDFYLHLHLPPELDIPLPATTQIFHQPPSSYLIPRWDLGLESGAFTRIEFPKVGSGEGRVSQDEIDTFETILAQCTAFLEKTPVGPGQKGTEKYNPQNFGVGEGYVGSGEASGKIATGPGGKGGQGHLVLVDEEDGSVVGELGEGYEIDQAAGVRPGQKDPVEISMPQEGQPNRITVAPVSDEYLRMARHPAYADSRIVQNAAMASRLIVTGSTQLSNAMTSGANAFAMRTKPVAKPMTFSPATQERVRKLNNLTHGAVGLSAATVGSLGKFAQTFGAKLAQRDKDEQRAQSASTGGVDRHGRALPAAQYKPGVLNKSMIAFSTIADGIEQGAKQLLSTGAEASSSMVRHRYGDQAGQLAGHLAGGVRNVGLVYVDATGVSRKAVLKSVAKGMVVGRMNGGQQVVVGGGDGGEIPQDTQQQIQQGQNQHGAGYGYGGQAAGGKEEATGGGYGSGSGSGNGNGSRKVEPASALEAARLQALAHSSTVSAPPPYSDQGGRGEKFLDAKYR